MKADIVKLRAARERWLSEAAREAGHAEQAEPGSLIKAVHESNARNYRALAANAKGELRELGVTFEGG